jgi:hypothetical protein
VYRKNDRFGEWDIRKFLYIPNVEIFSLFGSFLLPLMNSRENFNFSHDYLNIHKTGLKPPLGGWGFIDEGFARFICSSKRTRI